MGTPNKNLYEITAISGGKDQTLVGLSSGEVLGWGGAGCGRIAAGYVDICSNRGPLLSLFILQNLLYIQMFLLDMVSA